MNDRTANDQKLADVDLSQLMEDLSVWLGGMNQFIAATKREWQTAPTGYHLMAQRLRKLTLDLERDAKGISVRLKANGQEEKGQA